MTVLFKALAMFVTVFIVFRVFGKRMVAELTPMDRVAMIAYGTIAGSTSIQRSVPLYAGLAAVLAFAVLAWIAGRLSLASPMLRRWLLGTPRPVVIKGEVKASQLKKAGISVDDLWMRLHQHKVSSLSDVELAEIEPDGKLGLLESKSSKEYEPSRTGSDHAPEPGGSSSR